MRPSRAARAVRPGRMEDHQRAGGRGDAGEFRQAGHIIGQVLHQTGGEHGINGYVRQRKVPHVSKDQQHITETETFLRAGELLRRVVDADDAATGTDRLPQGGQSPTRSATHEAFAEGASSAGDSSRACRKAATAGWMGASPTTVTTRTPTPTPTQRGMGLRGSTLERADHGDAGPNSPLAQSDLSTSIVRGHSARFRKRFSCGGSGS